MYSGALPIAAVGIIWAVVGAKSVSQREFSIHPALRTKITFFGNGAVIGGAGAVLGGIVMATPPVFALITDSATWGDKIVPGFLIGLAVTVIGILLAFTQDG